MKLFLSFAVPFSIVMATSTAADIVDDTVDPSFKFIGEGLCEDANMKVPWSIKSFKGLDLRACQKLCKATDKCMGITWTDNDWIGGGEKLGCEMFVGDSTQEVLIPVENASIRLFWGGFNCYAYLTPTMGCIVKKEKKHGYNDCETLMEKKECASEVLCEWKENNVNECAHVCAVETKKQCKQITFQGKKICKFKK